MANAWSTILQSYPQYTGGYYNTTIGQGGIDGGAGLQALQNLPDNPYLNVRQELHNQPGVLGQVTPEQEREMNRQNVDSYRQQLPQLTVPLGQQMQSGNANMQLQQVGAATNLANQFQGLENGAAAAQRQNQIALFNAQNSIRNNFLGSTGILSKMFSGMF